MALPDSFQPYYLLKPSASAVDILVSGGTNTLTAGQIGFFPTPIETGIMSTATTTATGAPVVIGVGSWHTKDVLGPNWGGLQAPEYTQIIDCILCFLGDKKVVRDQLSATVTSTLSCIVMYMLSCIVCPCICRCGCL